MAKKPRPIRIEGDVAYVPLTQGYTAIIDAADVPLVGGVCWCAQPRKAADGSLLTVYALGRNLSENKQDALHRILLGAGKGQSIDHINGDGLDNRRANLRLCNESMNGANRRIGCNNTSGFKGVTWNTNVDRWFVAIQVAKKSKYVGIFHDKIEAAHAYDQAMVDAFGEFAKTNAALGLLPASVGGAVQ